MKWFVGLHPKYLERKEGMLDDFSKSGADILFTTIDFVQVGIDYQAKDKILVVFIENPRNSSDMWNSLPSLLSELKAKWGEVFIIGPSDNRTREVVESIFPQRNFFPLWVTLPYSYRLYQKKVEPSYGDYLMAWAYSPVKGRKELEAASVFVNLQIHDYTTEGSSPTVWATRMHFESRGLLWASHHDSVSRAFTSAAISRKAAIMLRTNAQLFNTYGDLDPEFFNAVLLSENTWDWLLSARQVLDNLDYAMEWGLKLYRFFERHEEFWKWEIIWERFKDQTGLRLPKDMIPVHHFLPTFFEANYFDNEEYFPQGPWSNEPPSVNWETGLGL